MQTVISRDQTALQSILGTEEEPLIVEIAGEDYGVMEEISLRVMEVMREDPAIFNVTSSLEEGMPEIEVVVDRLQARLNNVSVEAITSQIENRLRGTPAGQLDHKGEMKDIFIRLPHVSRSELEDITIMSGEREFPLNMLADIRISTSPKEVIRHRSWKG